MKIWDIDEFIRECEELCRNQYTYDYSKMPAGVCNEHSVSAYEGSWHSIVIDGIICNMAAINERYPNGNCICRIDDGKDVNALEYVRYVLSK